MVTISDRAVDRLREQLIHKCFEAGIGFKFLIDTDASGRASFSIKIDMQHQGDEVIDLNDVKVFLDPTSAARMSHYQLDYQDEPDGGFFLNITQEAKSG